MASEKGRTGWSYDPLVAGIRDGVAAGYDALEYVLEGLSASLDRRSRTGAHRAHGVRHGEGGYGGRRGGRGAPLDVVDDVASIAAEIIGLLGEVAQETAESITERARPARRGECVPLELMAEPGYEAAVDFHVWNTSSTVLHGIDLVASELVDHDNRIGADAVRFVPARLDRILPGRSATVQVVVTVPRGTTPGTYRGVVQAEPGGAWAVLELEVVPEEEKKAEAPTSTAQQSVAEPAAAAEPQEPVQGPERSSAQSARRARRRRLQ
jgi:hypothetical protein